MPRYRQLLAVVVLAAVVPVAWAAEKPSFTLTKAVPADVYLCVSAAHNPEAEYLSKYWGEVWDEVKKAGVVGDIHELIASSVAPADREKFETFWKRAGELIDGVDWNARVAEMAYVGRMGTPTPEFLLMLRYEDAEKAGKNGEAFAAVLKELQTVTGGENGGLVLADAESHGAKVSTLSAKDAPFLNLRVAVREAVVVIAFDRGMLDESLAMLAGEGGKKSLAESERYTQAMAKLPAPEDAAVFFDVTAMIEGIRGILNFGLQQAPPNESTKNVFAVMDKVLDECSLIDYVASTVHTEGFQQIDESVVTMGPKASKSRLYKVFCQPEPIEKFDRFIPKEAMAYSVSSGIDFGGLYAAAMDFIAKDIPDGENLLVGWKQAQEQIGFNPERDLFSWLGKQMISVTLPSATPSPFGGDDTVFMIQVRNEKQAAEKIKTGLDKLNDLLTANRSPLTSQPADVEGAKDFRMVTHPLVAMFLHPVYGVADGYLIIGSSPKAVALCLATAKGEHPSVSKNERVTREGIVPKGPVTSADFTDLTGLGKGLAQGLGMLGMFSGFIPNEPDTKPIREMIRIVGKLSPAAMKLDFFVSSSSVTTFEKNAWHTRKVTNYRDPSKTKAAEAGTTTGS